MTFGRVTRRTLIKSAGAVGAAGVFPGLGTSPAGRASAQAPGSDHIDVAIVGGGISGVYCAWRLKQADPSLNIVVFEQGNHIGGRLLSARPPGISNMVAELGGMRYLPPIHQRLVRLIDALDRNLPEDEQIQTYPFPGSQPQNIAYLRGTRLRMSDFVDAPESVPYRLAQSERGIAPFQLAVQAIDRIVPGITDLSLTGEARRAMAREAVFDGVPLRDQGLWNVMLRVMSNEARNLFVDASGYGTVVRNLNAVDGINLYLESHGVTSGHRAFVQGYQHIPETLADFFLQQGGDIRLATRITAMEWDGDAFELQHSMGTSRAGSIILAMPKRSLELLSPGSALLREFSNLLATVTPVPAMKLFATYQQPWWRSIGGGSADPIQQGVSTTDLPIRQVYYWPRTDGRPVTDGSAMLMGSYNSGAVRGYWDALRPLPANASASGDADVQPATMMTGSCLDLNTDRWCQHRVPERLLDEASRQLSLLHGVSPAPEIVDAAYRDWNDDPFGGGWHFWNVGVNSQDAIPQIVQPSRQHPLYICGEAYSGTHGWVEGALQTADMVLERFNLAPL
ncbi:MAG: FAD-dependent oxidoreductase [Pseudomonadota bacterium]